MLEIAGMELEAAVCSGHEELVVAVEKLLHGKLRLFAVVMMMMVCVPGGGQEDLVDQ